MKLPPITPYVVLAAICFANFILKLFVLKELVHTISPQMFFYLSPLFTPSKTTI